MEFGKIEATTPVWTFKCADCAGQLRLESYLHKDAIQHQFGEITQTVVAMASGAVVGYITYSLCSVSFSSERDAANAGFDEYDGSTIPTLRIYWLAVAEGYRRKGIGTQLMYHLFETVTFIHRILPCPLLFVEAYSDSAEFYTKFGFVTGSDVMQSGREDVSLMFADWSDAEIYLSPELK